MKLRFLGGAQTVTGSKTLVTTGRHRFLVDCGLFQGLKDLRLRNWSPLPVDAREIDAVLLTHAHLDHSGYLPLLLKQGFRGEILCSAPTRDLAEALLKDSARLQEEDADFANREGFSKHHPARPLYAAADVQATLERFRVAAPGEWHALPGGSRFRLVPNGHILGSCSVVLECEGKQVVFSGDLGRAEPLLYPAAEPIGQADALVVESTYGDRSRHAADPELELSRLIGEAISRRGKLIIPSFAVGRVQDLLFLLSRLKERSQLPAIPIYLDTPLGRQATEIFESHPDWHRLQPEQVRAMWEIARVVKSQRESIEVMREEGPAIVIAGSGMVTGGRVLHHLACHLPDPRTIVLLVGFQASGTRGRLLREGISELKIHGRYVPVRAAIREITGLSAHSDQAELVSWLKSFRSAPAVTYINHGEPQASDALRVKIRDELGWRCELPAPDQEYEL